MSHKPTPWPRHLIGMTHAAERTRLFRQQYQQQPTPEPWPRYPDYTPPLTDPLQPPGTRDRIYIDEVEITHRPVTAEHLTPRMRNGLIRLLLHPSPDTREQGIELLITQAYPDGKEMDEADAARCRAILTTLREVQGELLTCWSQILNHYPHPGLPYRNEAVLFLTPHQLRCWRLAPLWLPFLYPSGRQLLEDGELDQMIREGMPPSPVPLASFLRVPQPVSSPSGRQLGRGNMHTYWHAYRYRSFGIINSKHIIYIDTVERKESMRPIIPLDEAVLCFEQVNVRGAQTFQEFARRCVWGMDTWGISRRPSPNLMSILVDYRVRPADLDIDDHPSQPDPE